MRRRPKPKGLFPKSYTFKLRFDGDTDPGRGGDEFVGSAGVDAEGSVKTKCTTEKYETKNPANKMGGFWTDKVHAEALIVMETKIRAGSETDDFHVTAGNKITGEFASGPITLVWGGFEFTIEQTKGFNESKVDSDEKKASVPYHECENAHAIYYAKCKLETSADNQSGALAGRTIVGSAYAKGETITVFKLGSEEVNSEEEDEVELEVF